jgi:two-component system, response regulator, stage 0 sporulation protein F
MSAPAESPHILVVDDEEDVDLLFRHQFRREIRNGRVSLAFAHSADEAISYLRANPVHRVFSDINMPGMSGLDLLRVIREEFGPLPVHMISAYADEGSVQHAAEVGATGFFPKPIDFDALKQAAVVD